MADGSVWVQIDNKRMPRAASGAKDRDQDRVVGQLFPEPRGSSIDPRPPRTLNAVALSRWSRSEATMTGMSIRRRRRSAPFVLARRCARRWARCRRGCFAIRSDILVAAPSAEVPGAARRRLRRRRRAGSMPRAIWPMRRARRWRPHGAVRSAPRTSESMPLGWFGLFETVERIDADAVPGLLPDPASGVGRRRHAAGGARRLYRRGRGGARLYRARATSIRRT